jgi:hypothetical protein
MHRVTAGKGGCRKTGSSAHLFIGTVSRDETSVILGTLAIAFLGRIYAEIRISRTNRHIA